MNERDGPGKRKCFILELHDVAARFLPDTEKMLEWAERFAADEPVMMWTPRWLGESRREADEKLARKMSRLKGELVLHGFHHYVPGTVWQGLGYGEPYEAEFKRLDRDAAYRLLKEGKTLLEEWSGRPVRWFCAPRWQQSRGTGRALADLGFAGCFMKDRIVCFSGADMFLPVISFDFGTRKMVVGFNRWLREIRLRRILSAGTPFRLALHPHDMGQPEVAAELASLKDRLQSAGWQAVALKSLFHT